MVVLLCHPNLPTRNAMGRHLLRPLLLTEPWLYPLCLAQLTSALSSSSSSSSIHVHPTTTTRVLEALLALEKVAISLKLPFLASSSSSPSSSSATPPAKATALVTVFLRDHASAHPSTSVRLDGLSWIVDPRSSTPSTSSSWPLLSSTLLDVLSHFVHLNVHEPSTAFRDRVVACFQPWWSRFLESCTQVHQARLRWRRQDKNDPKKEEKDKEKEDQATHLLAMYTRFLQGWLDWLVFGLLSPTTSAYATLAFQVGFLPFLLDLLPKVPFLPVTVNEDLLWEALMGVFQECSYEPLLRGVVKVWKQLGKGPGSSPHLEKVYSLLLHLLKSPKGPAMVKVKLVVEYLGALHGVAPKVFEKVVLGGGGGGGNGEGVDLDPGSEKKGLETFFWQLFSKAQAQLELAKTSLLQASTQEPLPSTLCALTALYAASSTPLCPTPRPCFQLIQQAYALVHDVVACDSPEGTLPEDYDAEGDATYDHGLEDLDDLDASCASQLVVSLGWRVVKEGGALLSAVVDPLDPRQKVGYCFF
ncbi:hypothetical protein HMI54_010318 [Coelomomyces lativittatus]|nr:hypothetical protein HMI54_010318 [Coelomomyces lativittatus]